jgi:hypothetical protein
MRGGTRRRTACYRPAIDNDDRPSALAQLVRRRQPGNTAPNDNCIVPFVPLQRDGLGATAIFLQRDLLVIGTLNSTQETAPRVTGSHTYEPRGE